LNEKSTKKEIDLLDFWRILLKRKWIVIASVAIVVLISGINSFTKTPLYRASATILIEEPSSSMLDIQEILNYGTYQQDYLGTYFNTQLELLTSRALGERVAKKMKLSSRPEFNTPVKPKRNLIQTAKRYLLLNWIIPGEKQPSKEETEAVRPVDPDAMMAFTVIGGLSISPIEDTKIVEVSYTSPYPVLAADTVNTVVEEFINYSIETRYEATRRASEFLTDQITQLREDLANAEKELQKYGEEKEIMFLNENESTAVSRFSEINTEYTKATMERIKKEAEYRELRNMEPNSIPQSLNNPTIQSLKDQYISLKNEYLEKSKTFKPNYPEMIRLRTRLEGTQSDLQAEIQKAVDAADTEYRTALQRELSLKNLLETQRTNVIEMNNNAILYNSLKIDVENKRTLLTSLSAKQNETLISAQLGGISQNNTMIVDKALVPGAPFSPNIRSKLTMAFLMGILIGIGFVYIIEYLDNTIKEPEELEKLVGLPSLGIIPYISPNGIKKSSYYTNYYYSRRKGYSSKDRNIPDVNKIELINHLYPKFSISEDYRTIRTSILFSNPDHPPQTIAVTSSLPQEGKSATAVNMAISFSQLDMKVLIIDGDLRKPRLNDIFEIDNAKGLSAFLVGEATDKEVIQKTSIKKIWALPSGPHPPNPSELLNSEKMKELLKITKEQFDIVFIDTPPVLAVVDPIIISSLSDGTVIVLRGNKTTRKPLTRAIQELKKVNAHVIGAIFNEVKIKKSRYYSPYYHYYHHDYYEETND